MQSRWTRHFWWILILASFVSFAGFTRRFEPQQTDWATLASSTALIAMLAFFRIRLGGVETNLAHAVSIMAGLALGPAAAGIALTLGHSFGELMRSRWEGHREGIIPNPWADLRQWSLSYSIHALSLFAGFGAFRWFGGSSLTLAEPFPSPLSAAALALTFSAVFLLLHWTSRQLLESHRPSTRENLTLLLLAIFPTPFAIASAAAYMNMEIIAFLIFGGVAVLVSAILRSMNQAEVNLQRRLDELSTLSEVSRALRTSLDLDSLLTTIYLQVAHLLNVDSFYVALLSEKENIISYPIAVKDGERQDWPMRPLARRLTEHVIHNGTPLLISKSAPEAMQAMNFPDLDNAPEAWLGVPLTNPQGTFGCLVVFHTKKNRNLTIKDQGILQTLAGQAAVAIDNAMLYGQTKSRVEALALLHEITASMSSTLDPERALELVVKSMIRVGGGQKAAIYLIEPNRQQRFLARTHNLSDAFIEVAMTIPLNAGGSKEGGTLSDPLVIPDLKDPRAATQLQDQLLVEGVRAMVELPLTTPEGVIGNVNVFYEEEQRFSADRLDLLRTFAAHAALAVANARVHAETDQALRQRIDQLSALDSIGRELSSTLDLDQLSHVILNHALRYTNSQIGYVGLWSEENHMLRITAHRGCASESQITKLAHIKPDPRSASVRALETLLPQNVPDILEEPTFEDWSGQRARSALHMPIVSEGHAIGLIIVESPSPANYWPEQERLLSQLAIQSGIALNNALLYEQLQSRLREQSNLLQAGTRIASSLEGDFVLQAILESMRTLLMVEGASLFRWDPQTGNLQLHGHVEAHPNPPLQEQQPMTIQTAPALLESVRKRKPIQWSHRDSPTEGDLEHLKQLGNAKHALAIPLLVGDEVLGLIEIHNKLETHFTHQEITLAQTLASQAALALKNTDLFRQIRRSHERMLTVLNSTQEGILMIDLKGRGVIANHQFEQLTDLPLREVIGADLADRSLGAAPKLGYNQQSLEIRLRQLQKEKPSIEPPSTYTLEGPPARILHRVEAPVHDAAGELMGWLIALRDISKEQKLADARRHLTEMIVHDLRSPLTAILGSLKILEKTSPDTDSEGIPGQALDVAQRSCEQMLGLVNSLLDIAKLESGEMPLRPELLDLKLLAEEAYRALLPTAKESGIIFSTRLTEDAVPYTGDKEKLQRVLTNLLDNALKFTPAGGQVDLMMEKDQEQVHISVLDTGPGVPVEFRQNIFERFTQIADTTGRRQGTGLGLAFSKLAVEAHAGRIWVDDNPHGGSIFHVVLPRAA